MYAVLPSLHKTFSFLFPCMVKQKENFYPKVQSTWAELHLGLNDQPAIYIKNKFDKPLSHLIIYF